MSRDTRSSARLKARVETRAATHPPPPAITTPSEQETVSFENASAFETWLSTSHAAQTTGIWLKISKKGSGIPSVTYDDAVSTAICYGWIDGQRRAYDDKCFLQRFTPRRKGSLWSKRNVDRVEALVRSGRMRSAGQAEVDAAKADGRWERAYAGSGSMEVPPDFQAALEGSEEARRVFETLGKAQRYPFLFRVVTAKSPGARERKIRQFVQLLEQNKAP
jgi:uncharacterized protein YdeI (YjbR/CyaY-like superfamily)